MKVGLRNPHRTSNVVLAEGEITYPLRERYKRTNYTLEGREAAARLEADTDAEDEPPLPAPFEEPPLPAPQLRI